MDVLLCRSHTMTTLTNQNEAPKVWNKRKGVPADAVYVGRPTKWGNPWSHLPPAIDLSVTIVPTREEAVEKYLLWITSDDKDAIRLRQQAQTELKGKHLVCWCAPASCHADILLQIAND